MILKLYSPHEKTLRTVAVLLLVGSCPIGQTWAACNRFYFGPQQEHTQTCRCDETSSSLDCLEGRELTFEWPHDDSQLVRVVSDRSGARFRVDTVAAESVLESTDEDSHDDQSGRIVEVDIGRRLQQVVGYGGAFTDSASMLLGRLPGRVRAAALASYFGPTGLGYNLARVPVGGTDMSVRPYSCDDLAQMAEPADDFGLAHFRLQPEDMDYKLPLIRQVNELRQADGLDQLKLLFSSWSAPDWMKSNQSLVQGHLRGPTDGPYYAAYARYILKYIRAYEEHLNCSAWALTPSNEPCTPGRLGVQVVNYNSVNFEPHEMGDFLRLHLIPHLLELEKEAAAAPSNSSKPRRLALFTWDDTLLGLDRYRDLLFSDPQVYEFTRGLAVHWYSQGLDKLPYKSLFQVRRWLPHKFSLLSTEASFIGRPRPGDWSRGSKYARDIIENLRAGAVGWIDWNLALNLVGGPTWSGNYLDAALLVDEQRQAVHKNPMFYAIGHLTRFMRPGCFVLPSQVYKAGVAEARQQQQKQPQVAAAANATTGQQRQRLIWKMIDEDEEQTSELLVVAGELNPQEQQREQQADGVFWRQVSLVLLNRSAARLRTRVRLANCRSRLGQRPLTIELDADSITSLALNC